MKFSIKNINFTPAGHEDPKNPSVLKKVILTVKDIKINGVIQMINWAKMEKGKNFSRHYHQNMDEIFIIISGTARIKINKEQATLEASDTIYIPLKAEHEMKNIGKGNLVYIAIGIVRKSGGKTIIVKSK